MRKGSGLGLTILSCFLLSAGLEEGSGIFGRWVRDENRLVAYQYELDQVSDPRAVWDQVGERSRLMWHQLGNLRINAIATNEGFVQLFYNDSAQRWLNYYEPEKRKYAGGFGLVLDGETIFTSYYPFSPRQGSHLRRFGQGYFEKELSYNQVQLWERIFAPWGNLPVLIMQVKLKNLSSQKKKLIYLAYFDLNPKELGILSLGSPTHTHKFKLELIPEQSLLIARSKKLWGEKGGYPKKTMKADPEPPDLFLSALDVKAKSAVIHPEEIFSKDGLKAGASLKNLSWTLLRDAEISAEEICLALAVELELLPSEEREINFAYGYAKGERVEDLLVQLKNPSQLFQETINYWKDKKPKLSLPQEEFLSRELEWSHYYLVSSFLYDAYYERHFAPQGGNYLYFSGMHGAMRDLSAYILALIYYQPDLAREMIEFCLRNQESSGRLFYDFGGYGSRYSVSYRPSDLSLWLIWALTEYIFATRDFAFLKTELPYWPKERGETGTVQEHLIRAYDHLQNEVGLGPHGLLRLKMSDWNDEMTFLVTKGDLIDFLLTYSRGESHLNSAMACYILPNFSKLLRAGGEAKKAEEVEGFYQRIKTALQKEWLSSGWFPRAYSALGKSLGKKEIFLEPQVWALLSPELLSKEQREILVKNLEEKLRKPSKLGMLISNDTTGSLTTKPGEQEKGGIWFAINGPGAFALAQFDPKMGYEELKRNTLYWHAQNYPELWFGIWSGPDAFNSVFSKRPGQTWYVNFPLKIGPQFWPIQNNHPHAQLLYSLAKLVGFEPTPEGYLIQPLLPLPYYQWETPVLGLEKSQNRLRGYFLFNNSGEMILKVKLPKNFSEKITVQVEGKESKFNLEEGIVRFPLCYHAGKKVSWEIKEEVK